MIYHYHKKEKKKCSFCKRILSVNYFGVLRSARDGFNTATKECRNYCRRKAYPKARDTFETILPLREHNEFRLDLSDSLENIEIKGIQSNTNSSVKLVIQRTKSGNLIGKITFDDLSYLWICGTNKPQVFKQLLNKMLFEMDLKLI